MNIRISIELDSRYLSDLEAFLETIENGETEKRAPREKTETTATTAMTELIEDVEANMVEEIPEETTEQSEADEKPVQFQLNLGKAPAKEESETPEESSTQSFTIEDARARAMECFKTGKRSAVTEALAKVGAKKVTEISKDKLGEFMGVLENAGH